MSNQPLNPVAVFEKAMRERDLDQAWEAAKKAQPLSLDRALRLCLLLADRWDARYEKAARRLLARVLGELNNLPLIEAKKFADALAHVHDTTYALTVRDALEQNVEELGRLELRGHFDSLVGR